MYYRNQCFEKYRKKGTEVKSNIIKEKVYCMKCIFQPPRDLLILTLNGIDDKN